METVSALSRAVRWQSRSNKGETGTLLEKLVQSCTKAG